MSSEWIAPEELCVYQLMIYQGKFNANYGSYILHYDAAHRGGRISADRMNYVVEQTVLIRLKGEAPTAGYLASKCEHAGFGTNVRS